MNQEPGSEGSAQYRNKQNGADAQVRTKSRNQGRKNVTRRDNARENHRDEEKRDRKGRAPKLRKESAKRPHGGIQNNNGQTRRKQRSSPGRPNKRKMQKRYIE